MLGIKAVPECFGARLSCVKVNTLSSKALSEWIEIVVPASVSLAEGLASELIQNVEAAAQGVQVRKAEVVLWVQSSKLEQSLDQVKLHLEELQKQGWQIDPLAVRSGKLAPEEEWRDAWKKHFHVSQLTRQIVVVPSWEAYNAKASDLVIHLDPGQAFGTGSHASTQLVLEELQELVDEHTIMPPVQVFDLGTGSGILAIAATLFWPNTKVIATDIDPLSITATNENSENNAVSEKIEVSTMALTEVPGTYPLVLANIQAHILRELRDDLLPKVEHGGRLLVSGILSSQIQPLCDFYTEVQGIELIKIRQSKLNPDWSSAHFLCKQSL